MKFKVVMSMVDERNFDDFTKALKFFLTRFRDIATPGMSLNVLTNGCYIELLKDESIPQALYTHDILKAAHELGLMIDMELVDPLPHISDDHIEALFFAAHINRIEAVVDLWIDGMAVQLSGGDPIEAENIRRRLKGFRDSIR